MGPARFTFFSPEQHGLSLGQKSPPPAPGTTKTPSSPTHDDPKTFAKQESEGAGGRAAGKSVARLCAGRQLEILFCPRSSILVPCVIIPYTRCTDNDTDHPPIYCTLCRTCICPGNRCYRLSCRSYGSHAST